MKEKRLLSKIEKNIAKGDRAKCIHFLNSYFKKRYDLKILLTSGVQYKYLLENVNFLADSIQEFYSEEEISVFAEFGLTNFVQKLLDNNWGGINKGALLEYVPELINYDNLKDLTYDRLYDLYVKYGNDDVMRKFTEETDVEKGLKLYKNKNAEINKNIKNVIFTKFYENVNYVTYFKELLTEDDKQIFINLILSQTDKASVERAYYLFLLTNNTSLYDHIKKYDTGRYTYYLLKNCINFTKEEKTDLIKKLEKCEGEDKQYKLFYLAYSYKNNPSKLSSQLFTNVGGIALFFLTLEAVCTNSVELIKLKKLYETELNHDKNILIQKVNGIKINEKFDFAKFKEENEAFAAIQSSFKKRKTSDTD